MRVTAMATRRDVLALALGAMTLPLTGRVLNAATPRGVTLHGLSAFGDLKYPKGFTHFDYASPEAPKGGRFHFSPPNWLFNQNTDTFNTLNTFVRRGDAPPRMEICFDSLMVSALDEPDAIYGLLADSVTISDDGNSYVFALRPEARWHDGTPVTAADAAWTYGLLKEKGHPALALPLVSLKEAVAEDDYTLRLTFDGDQSPRLILSVAGYPILSKAWYAGRDFESPDMQAPLGSGPYRVGRVVPGSSIEYERVPDWWARDLGVARGLNHFDVIRIDFFQDRQPAFEAFKKGDIHFRQEFTSKVWATEYVFPAVSEGKVMRREFPDEKRPTMQGWALNQRRARFADPRVREAIGLAFDFEWTNANLFYGLYERSQSLFETSDFRAAGKPQGDELALAERLRDSLPAAVFEDVPEWPASDGSGRDRTLLQRASRLLDEAGWAGAGGRRNAAGETLDVELLIQSAVFERIYNPFVASLQRIGVNASLRMVDPAQFQARLNDFDFDMVGIAMSLEATPTADGLEQLFGSKGASTPGTRNLPGTSDPAIDLLIGDIGRAGSREQLTAAMRLLDRVLRIRRDWIPNWHSANHRAAWWDMFGFKDPKPDYGWPVEALWWFDAAKAGAIGKG